MENSQILSELLLLELSFLLLPRWPLFLLLPLDLLLLGLDRLLL